MRGKETQRGRGSGREGGREGENLESPEDGSRRHIHLRIRRL
jgi:hypothetical protein